MTKFIESTYEQITEQIASSRQLIEELSVERDSLRARFSIKPGYATVVGLELEGALTKAIAELETALDGWLGLLSQKLSEPVEEKLGLSQVASLA
jgi:hypothetical protein